MVAWFAADQSVQKALVAKACQLADELSVDYLELRNRKRFDESWPCKTLYYTFRKPVSSDQEENLKGIPRKKGLWCAKPFNWNLSRALMNRWIVFILPIQPA